MDIHFVHTFSVGQVAMHILASVRRLNIESQGGVPSSPDNQVCVEQHTLTLFSDNLALDVLDLLVLSGMFYPCSTALLIILNCKRFSRSLFSSYYILIKYTSRVYFSGNERLKNRVLPFHSPGSYKGRAFPLLDGLLSPTAGGYMPPTMPTECSVGTTG